ncbi:hypothetical protein CL657_01000 [bacterium]|nr:hypothetical protein [bacterium]
MIKLRLYIILLLCMFCVSSNEAFETYYFSPDSVGSSARSIRLGGVEGMSSHADSVFENPAALYRIKRFSSSFFQTEFMEEVVYQNVAFATRTSFGVFGVGFFNVGVDNIPKTDKIEYEDYTDYFVRYYFNYQNSLLKGSYQYSVSDYIHIGVSGSYFFNDFDTVRGSGYNGDFGLLLDLGRFEFSMLIRNLISSNEVLYTDSEVGDNSSDGITEKLSIQNIYSVNYKLRNFTMYGQFKTVGEQRELHNTLGLQFNPRFLPFLKGSVAYKQYPLVAYEEGDLAMQDKNSLVFGLELNLSGLHFNYAYERSDHIQFEHKNYFSVGLSF